MPYPTEYRAAVFVKFNGKWDIYALTKDLNEAQNMLSRIQAKSSWTMKADLLDEPIRDPKRELAYSRLPK